MRTVALPTRALLHVGANGIGPAAEPEDEVSLATRVIARLDVKPSLNAVVKPIRFEGLRVVGDPRELATRYAKDADELLYIDVTASLYGHDALLDLVRWTAKGDIWIPLTVGGGVRSVEDVRAFMRAGADKVAINTAAVKDPRLISACAECFGSQAIVVSIQTKRRARGRMGFSLGQGVGIADERRTDARGPALSGGAGDAVLWGSSLAGRADAAPWWEAYMDGGREPSGRDALAWACEAAERGAGELLVTSVDRDGTGQGYDVEFLQALAPRVSVPIVASGGAGRLEHFGEALRAGADAIATATHLHRGGSIASIKAALAAEGMEVRT